MQNDDGSGPMFGKCHCEDFFLFGIMKSRACTSCGGVHYAGSQSMKPGHEVGSECFYISALCARHQRLREVKSFA